MRRLLLQAMRVAEEGGDPIGLSKSYYQLRGIEKLVPADADWRVELLPLMYPEEIQH